MAETEMADDEFYTGYLPEAPPGIGRRVRLAVAVILTLTAALALLVVTAQSGFSAAVYEFGVVRDFEGVVRAAPYPFLEVERPGRPVGSATAVSRYYLVDPFKHGAQVSDRVGQRTKIRGSLLYRDDQTMIEILPEELAKAEGAAAPAAAETSLGVHLLRGRILDSKCYLGIMKPGRGKVHRACATRCISGGIPPLFIVEGKEDSRHFLLVGEDGRTVNAEVLDFVDEPLEVKGEVTKTGDTWVLKADPASFRRL
jgi:hypothetical protein